MKKGERKRIECGKCRWLVLEEQVVMRLSGDINADVLSLGDGDQIHRKPHLKQQM
jgi:hypothetical protein